MDPRTASAGNPGSGQISETSKSASSAVEANLLKTRESSLVSIVIPAYNAAKTLDRTLRSVSAQTYAAIEVIVVDDGSVDGSGEIARLHCLKDSRVRLIQTLNGGVASARNRGINEARGEFVAPVDADDLWAPDKIEKQVSVLRKSGAQYGLCYTWSARIGPDDEIIADVPRIPIEGDVLLDLCRSNIIGNGSSALVRATVLDEVGLYDSSLRDQRAQGCEDWDIYLRIAERYKFALVPEHLTGYRQYPGNMSSDVMQMYRSACIVLRRVGDRRPDLNTSLRRGETTMLRWLFLQSVEYGQVKSATHLYRKLAKANQLEALVSIARVTVRLARNLKNAALERFNRKRYFGASLDERS